MESKDYSKLEHLKLIEAQIQRMADNSFKIKSWAITIIGSALIYWFKNSKNFEIAILILLVTLMFWWIDAYYLNLERCYRKLYNHVLVSIEDKYTLDISKYQDKCSQLYTAITSRPLRYSDFILLVFEIFIFGFKYLRFK